VVFQKFKDTSSTHELLGLRGVSKHFSEHLTPLAYRHVAITKDLEKYFQDAEGITPHEATVAENIHMYTRRIAMDKTFYKRETWEALCALEKLQEITYVHPDKECRHWCAAVSEEKAGVREKVHYHGRAKATGLLCKLLLSYHDLTRLSITSEAIESCLVAAITHQATSLRYLHLGAANLKTDHIKVIRLSCPNLVDLSLEETHQEHEVQSSSQ